MGANGGTLKMGGEPSPWRSRVWISRGLKHSELLALSGQKFAPRLMLRNHKIGS